MSDATAPTQAGATLEEALFIIRISDDDLLAAGFDPEWISPEYEPKNGPYAPIRIFNAGCPCCGGSTGGWTLVNLQTAVGHSTEWTHDEGETEAFEVAGMLNAAWMQGRQASNRALAESRKREAALREALEGLLVEWQKLSRYGSPLAKQGNEAVNFAKAALADTAGSVDVGAGL